MTFCTVFKVLFRSKSPIQIRIVINDQIIFQEFLEVFKSIRDVILPLRGDHQKNKIQDIIQKYEEDFGIGLLFLDLFLESKFN